MSAAGIIAFVLIGRVLEARARGKASAALHLLADLSVKEVELESGVSIPLEETAVGDRFIARPGDRIATDGTIVEGTSAVDASMVTGEPVPVDVSPKFGRGWHGQRRRAHRRGSHRSRLRNHARSHLRNGRER